MITNQSFVDRYIYGLSRLSEFVPTDDVIAGAAQMPEPITERDRKFFQIGQLIATLGAVEILKYVLRSEGIECIDDDGIDDLLNE